jgi:hypothetical protein
VNQGEEALRAFALTLGGTLITLLGVIAVLSGNALLALAGLALLAVGGCALIAALVGDLPQGRPALARISAETGSDLSVTALELVRRRLRGSTGPGGAPDEQVVRGRLRGLPVSVRARLALDETRPREATCRVDVPLDPSLAGTSRGAARLDAGGLELDVKDATVDDLLDALEELIALAAPLQGEGTPRVVRRRPREATVTRCPYCRSAIDDDVVVCERCATPQHAACFEEHGRCSVHACDGARARARERA